MTTSRFRLTALSAGVAAAIGAAPPILAQDGEALEEILVTGSYIRRTSFDGTKPVQVIDQQTIERIGASQPVDVLKELTVNSGSQFYNETNNRAGTAMFNVRNLGLGSTLTLINGKRGGIAPVADDTGTDYLDINQFPITMIERIEVLTDGASALYGSQAVAGVANIITRKGFEGFELSGSYSQSEIEQQDIGFAAGAQFGQGGFNIYASWYEQNEAFRSDFDWLNERLNPSPRESRFLSSTGSPGTYRGATLNAAGNAVPTGGNRVPDPDCEAAGGVLRSPGDSRCRYLFVDQVAIISAEERVQVFNEFEWEFSDRLRYYAEASYSNNIVKRPSCGATFNTGSAAGGGFTVPASHPFNFFVADPANSADILYVGPDAWDNSIHTATDLQVTARPLGREVNNTPLTPIHQAGIELHAHPQRCRVRYRRHLENGFVLWLGKLHAHHERAAQLSFRCFPESGESGRMESLRHAPRQSGAGFTQGRHEHGRQQRHHAGQVRYAFGQQCARAGTGHRPGIHRRPVRIQRQYGAGGVRQPVS